MAIQSETIRSQSHDSYHQQTNRETKKVLWVEDSPTTLRLYRHLSKRYENIAADFASSQKEALGLIVTKDYDSIITDYHLGDTNADEVIHQARERYGSVPILLVTSCSKDSFEVTSLQKYKILHEQKPLKRSSLSDFFALKQAE